MAWHVLTKEQLGGGFGEGFKVAGGYDFVGDGRELSPLHMDEQQFLTGVSLARLGRNYPR
jgi:hypothetical protein